MVLIERSSSSATVPASSQISQCKHRDLKYPLLIPHYVNVPQPPCLFFFVQRGSFSLLFILKVKMS